MLGKVIADIEALQSQTDQNAIKRSTAGSPEIWNLIALQAIFLEKHRFEAARGTVLIAIDPPEPLPLLNLQHHLRSLKKNLGRLQIQPGPH